VVHGNRNVLGKVDQHRARAAALRQVESFVHGGGDFADIADLVAVLHDRQGNAEDVHFLKSVGTLQG
jgi:hypothetical protein